MASRVDMVFDTDESPEASVARWMRDWSPYLIKQGFRPVGQTPTAISYAGKYLTLGRFVLGLLTFPVGILVWFFAKKAQGLTVTFEPVGGGTRWRITGNAFMRVRQMLTRCGFEPIGPERQNAPAGAGALRDSSPA